MAYGSSVYWPHTYVTYRIKFLYKRKYLHRKKTARKYMHIRWQDFRPFDAHTSLPQPFRIRDQKKREIIFISDNLSFASISDKFS